MGTERLPTIVSEPLEGEYVESQSSGHEESEGDAVLLILHAAFEKYQTDFASSDL